MHASHLWGSGFAYFAVAAGVFVTAFYSFRMYFLVFHGKENFRHKPFPGEHDHHDDDHGHGHHEPLVPHESPAVVWVPLVALAIPSVIAGYVIGPLVFGDFFKGAIEINLEAHPAMEELAKDFHGVMAMTLHGLHLAAVLARAGGRRGAVLVLHAQPGDPAGDQGALGLHLPTAREQVLPRLVQRERHRALRALDRPDALEGR